MSIKRQIIKFRNNIHFKSESDTEILINAIDIWGIEVALERCVGMFAFAAYHIPSQTLYLARDRFGEKPLYYGIQNNIFAFASELKGLKPLEQFGWNFDIDRNILATYMRYGYVPTPYSIYKNVYKLNPGTFLTINSNLQISKKSYWNPESALSMPKYTGNYDDAINTLEEILLDTLKLQMDSDVPLGAFLSGGVDSSLIVSLMQSFSSKKISTFSIGFENRAFDEAPYAKKIANCLGTHHTELYVTENDVKRVIPRLSQIYDEPFADSSQIPTFLVSQLATKSVTVSLSGDGGDELFAGYNRYLLAEKVKRKVLDRPLISHLLLNAPSKLLKGIGSFSKKYANLHEKLMKLKLLTSYSESSKINLYKMLCSQSYSTNFVYQANEIDMFFENNLMSYPQLSYQEWMMFADTKTYMMDDILTKVDRAAMSVSLETRVPFLDHRVFEFAWSLPLDYKIHKGVGKKILRDLLHRYVPPELVNRPKMGFGVPLDNWLRIDLKDWAAELIDPVKIKQQGYLNPDSITRYWNEHLSGKQNWSGALWTILMFQLWLDS